MTSLIVPFYNEAQRFYFFENGMKAYFEKNKWIKELILVNDGSRDHTLELLKDFKVRYNLIDCKIIDIKPNTGKGNAIKEGVKAATQEWILCNDADLSYLPQQLDEWIENGWINFDKANAVYFGSRELGMKKGWVKYHLHRRIIGRIYALFIRIFTGITVTDTQCGFKLYNAKVAKDVFSKIKEQRFAFDLEVFYLLRKNNVEINLLPLRCEERFASKVNLIKDSWNMFTAIFRIKNRYD